MNLQPPKTEFSAEEQAEIRTEILAALKGPPAITQAELGRQVAQAASKISSFLSNTYAGDSNIIAQALRKWLDERERVTNLRARMPSTPVFQPLPVSQQHIGLFDYAKEMGRFCTIIGAPGTSKTTTALHYCNNIDPGRAWLATMTKASPGVPPMLQRILAAMGVPGVKGTPDDLFEKVVNRAVKEKCLIIIDEFQHLSDNALELARAINDETRLRGRGAGVVLIGNEAANSKIGGTGTTEEFAQVSSRVAQRRKIKKPTVKDIMALVEAWCFVNGEHLDKPATDYLVDIGQRPGGLRNIEMTFENALLVSLQERTPLTLDHLQGAFLLIADQA